MPDSQFFGVALGVGLGQRPGVCCQIAGQPNDDWRRRGLLDNNIMRDFRKERRQGTSGKRRTKSGLQIVTSPAITQALGSRLNLRLAQRFWRRR